MRRHADSRHTRVDWGCNAAHILPFSTLTHMPTCHSTGLQHSMSGMRMVCIRRPATTSRVIPGNKFVKCQLSVSHGGRDLFIVSVHCQWRVRGEYTQ